jgi:hemerythrin-like domain-containing protein
MNAIEILQAQHEEIRTYFKKLTGGNGVAERPQHLDKLVEALRVHTTLEETLFYPAVRGLQTKKAEETVLEAYEEHNVADMLLNQLAAMDTHSEQFGARCRVLQTIVEEHIEGEDTELFKLAERLGEDDLEEIGDQMEHRIAEVQRVNEIIDRVTEVAERSERIAVAWIDIGLALPRRAFAALAPTRLFRLDRRRMWVPAIANALPSWVVEAIYDAVAGPSGRRITARLRRVQETAKRQAASVPSAAAA